MPPRKQLFLSHAWATDEGGRDTHARVRSLAGELVRLGWSVWLDESDLRGNVDASMAAGIDGARAVVVCLTRAYARKVNGGARTDGRQSNDNCHKEFAYACARRKPLVPVVFEPAMRNPSGWSPGVLPMRLSMELYVDGADDEPRRTAAAITSRLLGFGIRPAALARPPRRSGRGRVAWV